VLEQLYDMQRVRELATSILCFFMQSDYPRVAKQHGLKKATGDTNGRAVHHCIKGQRYLSYMS
jgi:hypothetical protein